MKKRLYKNIGIIAVLVGIITLLVSSTAQASLALARTYNPTKNGNSIEVTGTTQMVGSYDVVQCETQLFYWNGSVWVNLSSAITTEHNKDRAWVSYLYHDVQQDFNTYRAKSYHYWYDPLEGTGSYVTLSPHQVVL